MVEIKEISKAKRIVIKIGTSTIMKNNKEINYSLLGKIMGVVADLHQQGKEIVIVSSGAIGVGSSRMNLTKKPDKLKDKQAIAAIGQGILMHVYEDLFLKHGITVAQILLTRRDSEDDIQRYNIKNTFNALFGFRAIPIVNENDTVTVEEIVFGDNDTLSAVVSVLIKADLLLMLSDTDGFYNGDPRKNKEVNKISVIKDINKDIESFAHGAGSSFGTGGMKTKISAAKLVTRNGIDAVIIHGEEPEGMLELIKGKNVGTIFLSRKGNYE